MRKWILVLALVSFFNLGGLTGLNWPEGEADAAASKANLSKVVMVKMATPKGAIDIAVYPALMPVTCANFLKLVDSGFYNGLVFHRVENWVVQGGDPKGNGTGGPGWSIKLETHPDLKNIRGAVAMARAAHPDSAGSQFYILKTDASWLDGQYAVFGTVVKGMEVVDKLGIGDKMKISRQK